MPGGGLGLLISRFENVAATPPISTWRLIVD